MAKVFAMRSGYRLHAFGIFFKHRGVATICGMAVLQQTQCSS